MNSKARRTLAGVTAAVMIAAPAAQAIPIDAVQTGRPAHVAPSTLGTQSGALRTQTANTGTVESRPAPDGFDRTSAAIGAAVAAALALLSSAALRLRRPARA
jgi:hypothetical protein